MGDIAACLAAVSRAGYAVVDHFVLPESAWWDDYYGPMEDRLERLRQAHQGDASALDALAEHQQEIDYYRRYSACYGYVFVTARRADQ